MQVTLKDFGISLWKNLCLLVAAAVLGGVLAGGGTCLFAKPTYTVTAKLYVYNEKANDGYISQGDLNVSKSLVDTCLIIAKSGPVLQKTLQQLQPAYPDMTVKEIEELLEGGALNATEVFFLSVTDPDGQKAIDIVNTVASFVPEELMRITKAATAETIEAATIPEESDWPWARNGVLGAVLGLAVCAIWVVIAGKLDQTVYGRRELEANFRIPVIGVMPGNEAEGYRLAAAYITAGNCGKIAVTSAVSGEGKSRCATNLAQMLTNMGKRVLLTDANALNTEGNFDYSILDTPAVLTAADAAVVATHVDGYIVSAVAGVSNVEKMKEAVRILEQLNVNILGLIVHNLDPETEKYGRYCRWNKRKISAGEEQKV